MTRVTPSHRGDVEILAVEDITSDVPKRTGWFYRLRADSDHGPCTFKFRLQPDGTVETLDGGYIDTRGIDLKTIEIEEL